MAAQESPQMKWYVGACPSSPLPVCFLHANTPTLLLQIKAATFHFDPTLEVNKLKYWTLGISTPDQRTFAWKYGHDGFIMVDGTFNICDKYV